MVISHLQDKDRLYLKFEKDIFMSFHEDFANLQTYVHNFIIKKHFQNFYLKYSKSYIKLYLSRRITYISLMNV